MTHATMLKVAAILCAVALGLSGCGQGHQAKQGEGATEDTLDGDLFSSAARQVQKAVKNANESLMGYAERVDTVDLQKRIDDIAQGAQREMRNIARRVDEEIPQEKARASIDSIAAATRRQIDAIVDSVRALGNGE